MYTSAQTRAANPQTTAVNKRWALSMLFTSFAQKPIVNEDHKTVVVSMREHVMPLARKYKEDTATHVRNLLSRGAWASVVDLVKSQGGENKAHYKGSESLREDAKIIAERLKAAGFRTAALLVHSTGNMRQYQSLKGFLQDFGLKVEMSWSGCDVFLKDTLVIGQSEFILDVFSMSYHLDGPKSVPDVEGNDTVFFANFKPSLNHSEAVGIVSWKNYNSFALNP